MQVLRIFSQEYIKKNKKNWGKKCITFFSCKDILKFWLGCQRTDCENLQDEPSTVRGSSRESVVDDKDKTVNNSASTGLEVQLHT